RPAAGLYSGAQRQGDVQEGRISLTLLFNQFNAVGIIIQRRCSLADENRIKRDVKHLCGPVIVYDRAPKERLVTDGQSNRILGPGDPLKAAVFFEFTIDRSANVHSDDVLDVHEVGQLTAAVMMLFYHELVLV